MTLKQLRINKGLRQAKCADILQVSLRTYKRYESNEIAEIMDTKIVGWKRISSHRFRNYGTQKGWTRYVDDVNQNAEDGFRELTESEQQMLPF